MSAENPFLPECEVRKLIRQAQAGDADAFAEVVEQVRPFIYKLARQYARRAGGAPLDDLLQTGLLTAVRSVRLFDTDSGEMIVSG
jgi:DNA-directed RNA polymerase specialized sigma subunit